MYLLLYLIMFQEFWFDLCVVSMAFQGHLFFLKCLISGKMLPSQRLWARARESWSSSETRAWEKGSVCMAARGSGCARNFSHLIPEQVSTPGFVFLSLVCGDFTFVSSQLQRFCGALWSYFSTLCEEVHAEVSSAEGGSKNVGPCFPASTRVRILGCIEESPL